MYRRGLPEAEFLALSVWLETFWPFQREWLLETSDLAIYNKGRQIGISHTTGALGAVWGAFHGETTTVLSVGKLEAAEVLDKCRRHALALATLGSEMAALKDVNNRHEVRFASGGRVIALASSGGRGFTGNVILDEYAYHDHAEKAWDAVAPIATKGGRIRVVSTPNGVGNSFHGLWEKAHEPNSGWACHETSMTEAIAQGYPVDVERCWRLAKGDHRIFAQMFECSFLDSELQYIPWETINACCDAGYLEGLGDGEHYAGLDIGREADLTVLIVLRVVRRVRYLVHIEVMKRTDSDGLEAMVDRAFERFKLRRLCIDATGMGSFPADRIKKKHSERVDVPHRRPRVEPITFTPKTKDELATGLYTVMTDGAMVLPKSDAELPDCEPKTADSIRKDIASIRRVVTTSGNVTYDAPRTADGHADRAWALALAIHACSTPNAMLEALKARAGQ